ncbi:sensor histidine kinase [Roseomonas sp. HJA6]|uniref:histidine kinase n=1 Tax=Roseomonas alba TaxID=2846776 RepID=A0ABS7AE96_9PROT|nr:sensor histidine kinase [Neoroseomonas alba]MBW6400493.1 sensor histidine kinase [Neoroseomonas alba]
MLVATMRAYGAGWVVGAVSFAAAWAASHGLADPAGGLTFVAFLLAVLATSLAGGWAPATAVAVASVLVVLAWFLAPGQVERLPWPLPIVPIGLLAAVAGAQISLVHGLTRAVARLEWKRAQIEALRESEHLMFRELQHRIANGIQLVSSLLSLEADRVDSAEDAAAVLEDAVTRLSMIATIHRRLNDPALGKAGLEAALRVLAREILDAGGREGVDLHVVAPRLATTPADATSLAMFIAEAVTNALKHAFADREEGLVEITFTETPDGERRLTVRDDGPGFGAAPPEGGDSLGLLVMRSMAHRLDGRLEMADDPRGGAAVTIVLPPAG